MPKDEEPNLAKIVYQAYPHSDLLPIDPIQDCRSLKILKRRVAGDNIGDSLFRFLVFEMVEGGESTRDGAIRVVEQARDDVDAVLTVLIRVRQERCRKGRLP